MDAVKDAPKIDFAKMGGLVPGIVQDAKMKGETSGNRLRVVTSSTDCDNDALLFRVEVEGDGLVCHEGTVSCFTKPISVTNPEAE
jgi:phosphoribosyl-ATP pyrophosphohydrolase/phosphoribosyl-AMP cyclohydrolase